MSEPSANDESATPADKEHRLLPVFLSCGICPGLGQWMQGRKFIAVVYLSGFMGFFLLTMIAIFSIFTGTVGAIQRGDLEPAPIDWSILGNNFGMAVIVYLVNVVDIVLADRARKKQQAEVE